MLSITLAHLARGGIRDHLGGGFHRYSTDRYWRIPHFEKMLYDNAQLASVFAEAFVLTHDPELRRASEEILAFVSRELTSPEGAFFSALDAETDGDEGQYYVWTRRSTDLRTERGGRPAVGPGLWHLGRGQFRGAHVFQVVRPVADVARAEGMSAEDLQTRLDATRARLLAERDKRKRPLTDTKILTAWNGLMIRGFADCGRLLDEDRHLHRRNAQRTLY